MQVTHGESVTRRDVSEADEGVHHGQLARVIEFESWNASAVGQACRFRLRLRAALWRQWKTARRRRAALLNLGVRGPLASQTAGSGRGPWYLARSKALSVGLSNAYFKSLGLPSLIEER
jgi:hypothetical protein